jgi:hypothetical protein
LYCYIKELRHLRNFLNFRTTVVEERVQASAAKYPPLKKGTTFPPNERLACDNYMSQEALIAKAGPLYSR